MAKKFINPAPGSKLTSAFGNRTILGKKEFHYGVDLAKSGNVPILASADGIVVSRLKSVTTYGNVIFLNHVIGGKTYETVYAHLKSINVKEGQKVKQGDIIGYMGNTGRSTGQHLHFEIHDGKWITGRPNAKDPMLYIDKEESVNNNSNKKKLYLPKDVSSWAVYPTNKQPIKKNAIAYLNPKKFGGLEYDVLGNPQTDVVTIQTKQFGKVNIYVAKSTGAVIK